MYAAITLVTQPEAPSRTVIGLVVFTLLTIPVFIWGGNKGYTSSVLTFVGLILAGILSTIPVVNDLGRAVYRFAVSIAQAFGADELVSARIGVVVGVFLALAGIVAFHVRRTAPTFILMVMGMWFLFGTDWSRNAVTQVIDLAVWTWNRLPGVG